MKRAFEALTIIVLLTIVGCSNSINENDGEPEETTEVETPIYFTATIKEIYDSGAALVDGTRGKVLVSLSINKGEKFHVGDKVKVGYNGTIMESNPAQIKTLSVELVDE